MYINYIYFELLPHEFIGYYYYFDSEGVKLTGDTAFTKVIIIAIVAALIVLITSFLIGRMM